MSQSLILVSNDDGIRASGLAALCQAMLSLGEVIIMAPEVERSAVGHAITLSDPLRVNEVNLGLDGVRAYSCSGTPADCVKLAVRAVLPRRPDLVVSGINHGSNTGINVIYSGTVSAATEGTILGIPSVAFSLASWDVSDLAGPQEGLVRAKTIASQIATKVLEDGLPAGTLLNVNIPNLSREEPPAGVPQDRGYMLTTHGSADWEDQFDRRVDPHNRVYYWLTGRRRIITEPPNTDEEALKAGHVSVTPLHYDLTARHHWETFASWNLFQTA